MKTKQSPTENPSLLQQALKVVENDIETLIVSALLLKMQVEKPEVLSSDFADLMKIVDKKQFQPEVYIDEYHKSLTVLLEKHYSELKNDLGLAITNLTASLLFPNEARSSK